MTDTASTSNDRNLNPERFTLNDIHLAGVYWIILLEQARQNQRNQRPDLIQYAKLVDTAKSARPHDPVIQKAISTSIGRKLDPINWFCCSNEMPNLTCLAVNANGIPGEGYRRNSNWDEELAAVAAFDWEACTARFDLYLTDQRKSRIAAATKSRRPMPDVDARATLWEWWQPLRVQYPEITQEQKEKIVALLRQWVEIDEAVAAVLGIE